MHLTKNTPKKRQHEATSMMARNKRRFNYFVLSIVSGDHTAQAMTAAINTLTEKIAALENAACQGLSH